MKEINKKTVSLFLILCIIAGLFAGCSGNSGNNGNRGNDSSNDGGGSDNGQQGNQQSSGENSVYAEDQTLRILYSIEVSEWNYLVYSAAGDWSNYIDTLIEYDPYGNVIGALAESWDVSDDGLEWTFHIRKGVQWQTYDGAEYGQEVTANDWVTTAKYVLDPANAAATADYMFTIAGAEDYYNALVNGESADFSTVGVTAKDDYTLVYTLAAPCSYFLSTLTFNWGYPTCAQYLDEMGEDFGIDPFTFLYNGAYLCSDFEPESFRTDVKNESYWDAEHVYIETIERTFNAEADTIGAELFLRGEVTHTKLANTQIEQWLTDPELSQYVQPLTPARTTYWFGFNYWPTYDSSKYDVDSYLTAANNENFRKAFYYGLNRLAISAIYDPENPENLTLSTITPNGFASVGGKDYTEIGNLANYTVDNQYDEALAKEYMDTAVAELTEKGVKFPIQLYMPYRSTDTNQTSLAQVVEQQLENLFGNDVIDIILEGYPGTDYKNLTSRSGNYSFMLLWWGPDYADPVTYTEPFKIGQRYSFLYMADGEGTQVSEGQGTQGYDGGYWTDYHYDEIISDAKASVDDQVRYEKMAEAESWLIEHAYVIPCGLYDATGYAASYLNPFEKEYTFFGACQYKYKFQHIYADAMDAQEYAAAREVWEQERADSLK